MTITQQAPNADEAALGEFIGRAVGDLGATLSAALVVIGDRLGLYRAKAQLLSEAGFSQVRLAAQSPVNLIFEARP